MLNWKALIFGFIAMLVLLGLMQLIFLFVAIFSIQLVEAFPVLASVKTMLMRSIGFVLLALTLFSGGYFTAYLARESVVSHALITTSSAIVLSLVVTLDKYASSPLILALIASTLIFPTLGAKYWKKRSGY